MRRLFNKLNTKVIALALIVVIGSQIATVFSVLDYAEDEAEQRAADELATGERNFDNTLARRFENVARSGAALSQDPEFQFAIRNADSETLNMMLRIFVDQVETELAVVLQADGAVLASNRSAVPEGSSLAELLDKPRTLLFTEDKTFELILVPVKSGSVIGWVGLGFEITDGLAFRMAQATGLETTVFRTRTSGKVQLLASSLPVGERSLVSEALERVARGQRYQDANQEISRLFKSKITQYVDGDDRVSVLLHKRVNEARKPFVAMRETILHATGISLIGALFMAFLLSRAITTPVRKLAEAAQRISVGDYSRKIEIESADEFGALGEVFEDMRNGISEREQRITYQAEYDALTGLPNRLHAMESLREKLRESGRTGEPVVVMMMHLDRFREIQSSLGHEIGDEVLRQTANRMRAIMDEDQMLARLEGDQFLIVAPDAGRAEGERLGRQLSSVLDAGLNVQSVNITLDACIGFCISPDHGRQPDELLRRAAVAKNDAQVSQKRMRIYQNGREARNVRQLAILGDLKRATRENELQLYLQPKVTLGDTTVCGAEALLRWDHPELGQISPIEFIPVAENAGCIGMITEWMLGHAIAQARVWQDQGIDLPIAVNMSAQDLQSDNLPPMISHELDRHGVSADRLIFEITEEAVVRDIDHAIDVLNRLRELGIRISMDDFGTGYSSLSNLQNLPVDELKIDRSFVMSLPESAQNAAIVRAIINMAHNLNLEVVAEGVETTAALRWLREEGCERAQGYYLSKPMPANRFLSWLRSWEQIRRDEIEQMRSGGDAPDPNESLILRPRLIN